MSRPTGFAGFDSFWAGLQELRPLRAAYESFSAELDSIVELYSWYAELGCWEGEEASLLQHMTGAAIAWRI
jgi:hypothetical protein